jgi:menaquinone-dependent protoporphyrinogen oxidase
MSLSSRPGLAQVLRSTGRMKPILVLYATREGQTRKIAEHVAQYLVARGLDVCLEDVENPIESIDPAHFRAVVLAASIHHGPHAREMVGFVKANREVLARLPTAFLSVSLAAASAEDERQTGAKHPWTSAEVAKATQVFLDRTGLRPVRVLPVAGALLYSEYGHLVRFVMQRITQDSERGGSPSHDFEYAAWARLDRFIDGFLSLQPPARPQPGVLAHA